MTFLPIVARELRVAARRRGTYWIRTAAALAVIILGTWFFLVLQSQTSPHQMAMVLFCIMTGSCTLYCLLSGVRSTADCLSEEKREGTLGLLFLTDLKGYDVVLGKLVATSLSAFYGILAVVPMLAIPLLMGGVTPAEFGRTAVVAINTLFFSLAIGIFVSGISRSARKAMGMTLGIILLFAAVAPAIGAWVAHVTHASEIDPFFLRSSAGVTYFFALDYGYKRDADQFWWSLFVIHALGWVFLGLASVITPRTWQDRPAGAQVLRWRERWQLWSYGDSAERRAYRSHLLNQNAFFWLAARARLKPAHVWAALGLMACGWAWGLAKFHNDWLDSGIYLMTGVLLNILIKGWFAAESGRQLAEDRQRGALELLLSTPMTVRDIVRGQMLALKRQFLGPILVVLAIELICMNACLKGPGTSGDRGPWLAVWIGILVTMVVDVIALFWVGMWKGLTSRNPNRAASASLAQLVALPAAVYALLVLVVSLAAVQTRFEPSATLFICLWFGLGLLADVLFGAWARHRLLTSFRTAAAQRYEPRLGFWKRLWGGDTTAKNLLPTVISSPKRATE